MNTCYIFGAGEYYSPPPIMDGLIIAADGGYKQLALHGIRPHLLVGDFDSLDERPPGVDILELPREKDRTDTAAAIDIGLQRGCKCFEIYGGTGGRIEHTLANIQCIAHLAETGMRGILAGDGCMITAIANGGIAFRPLSSGYISVFAHSGRAENVCISGLKYTIDNGALSNTFPLGVSNEFIGQPSSISVQRGTLIIVYPLQAKED